MSKRQQAVLGLRARTARAVAVVLAGSRGSACAIERAELGLCSADNPATAQPYHAVLDMPWDQAQVVVRQVEATIVTLARDAIARIVAAARARGLDIVRVAVVGAPDRNLEKIGNSHIRAHAGEGVLYRRVLELGAADNGLDCKVFVENDLLIRATAELGLERASFSATLDRFGQTLGRPWRADEKLAATAAWLALSETP